MKTTKSHPINTSLWFLLLLLPRFLLVTVLVLDLVLLRVLVLVLLLLLLVHDVKHQSQIQNTKRPWWKGFVNLNFQLPFWTQDPCPNGLKHVVHPASHSLELGCFAGPILGQIALVAGETSLPDTRGTRGFCYNHLGWQAVQSCLQT